MGGKIDLRAALDQGFRDRYGDGKAVSRARTATELVHDYETLFIDVPSQCQNNTRLRADPDLTLTAR